MEFVKGNLFIFNPKEKKELFNLEFFFFLNSS